MHLIWVLVVIFLVSISANPFGPKETFNLTVIHINDWHSRYEETSDTSGPCKDPTKCIGGFSRMYRELQSHRERPNVLYLNAGDNYQGTLWFTLFGWNVTQYFLNKLPCDAYVSIFIYEKHGRYTNKVLLLYSMQLALRMCRLHSNFQLDCDWLIKIC